MKRLFFVLALLLSCASSWCDNAPAILTWDFTQGLQSWQPYNFESYKVTSQGFEGVSKYDCSFTSPKLDIDARDYDLAIVTAASSIGGVSDLFIGANNNPFSDSRKVTLFLPASATPVLLKFPLAKSSGWAGTINRIRFDPVNPAGSKIRIESITLCRKDTNMLENGGFEFCRNGAPLGWTFRNGAQILDSGAQSGKKCLALVAPLAQATTPFADLSFLGNYNLTFSHKGASAQAELDIRERHGKSILKRTMNLPASPDWTHHTELISVPDLSYEGTLTFSGAQQTAYIDSVSVTQVSVGAIKAPLPVAPSWKGSWIWCYDNRYDDHCTAWLRKSIELPDKPFHSACVQLSCDDAVAFFVNGNKVCDTNGIPEAWQKPVVLDIAKYLKPGANTFLAEAKDIASAQGFIANIAIDAGGSFITVNTGADWEASLSKDGPWAPAAPLGNPPCAPWYPLPYRPMGTMPTIGVTVGKLPKTAAPGDTIVIPVTPKSSVGDAAIGLKATLRQADRVLVESWCPSGLTDTGASVTMKIPVFATAAPATIQLELPGAKSPDALAFPIAIQSSKQSLTSDFPQTKLVTSNGVTWISINGKLHEPTQGLFCNYDRLQAENSRDCGLHLIDISPIECGFFEDGYNYDKVDNLLQIYLATDPDAWIFFTFTLSGRSHKWWLDKHPEATCRHEDGSNDLGGYSGDHRAWVSYSSPIWRKDFGDMLRNFIRHLRNTPYAARVVGFHPCNGISWEWFNWGSQSREFVDYSECGQNAFRAWLKEKYKSDAALQKAWNRTNITLATAAIPTSASRANPTNGRYYDAATQHDVIDYHDFQNFNVADTIRYFCHIIKEETRGNVLTGTYYGYTCHLFEQSFFSQNSGHFNARMLLDSPDFDFFIAPDAYTRREVGSSALTMVAEYTHILNGKLFWGQADLRTQWATNQRIYGNVTTVQQAVACMERELARSLAEGNAIQWYDFSHGWTMGDKRLTQVIKEQKAIINKYRPTVKDFPEENYMLFLIDENAMGLTNVYSPFYGGHLVDQQRLDLNVAGIPWRTVLLSDLFKFPERLLKYRAFVFLAPDRLTQGQIDFIRDNVMKNGRTVIFIGNVGVAGQNGLTTQPAEALLNQKFRIDHEPTYLNATCTPLWPELNGKTYGTHAGLTIRSVMLPENLPETQTLAKLAGSGIPAAFWKESADCKLLWSTVPHFSPDVIRAIAKRAGIPVVSDSNDNYYVGHGFVGIHAHSNGSKSIKLIGKGTPREIISGKTWPRGTDTIHLDLSCGDTRIFVVE